MSVPARPYFQKQGPACNCIIDGICLGWLTCSGNSMAMGINRATLGADKPTGCEVRRRTKDTAGGLSLPQVAMAAKSGWNVDVEVRVGPNVCLPSYAASECRNGRGFVLQGNTSVLVGTPHRSTGGPVNHAVWVNETRGGTEYEPEEASVYDPAADGRSASWGKAAQGPQWWSWALVKKFAADLRPWGDARTLGGGRFYAGFVRDTEPHVHLAHGGVAFDTLPNRFRAVVAEGSRVNVRSGPGTGHPVVDYLEREARWYGWQRAKGTVLAGSPDWYGDHDGRRWVHSAGMRIAP